MSEAKRVSTPKRKPVRKLLKSFVDVKKWSSYDEVSSNTKTTMSLFKRLLKHSQPQEIRKETYAEAIKRLALSTEQEQARKRNFLYSFLVYIGFDLMFFIYMIYLLINARFLATFVAFILVILMTLAAYREHFWYMQMTKKKLGCSFKDWKNFVLGREAN